MNGMDRVRKVVYEFNFAGLGGDGPGGLKFHVLRRQNYAYVAFTVLGGRSKEPRIMKQIGLFYIEGLENAATFTSRETREEM
ncbi:unnamed protein product [Durusdinium trenchii]|uniref:Uncharacterized protein n=1 Tax=Durusdinium trenchii TaxID=1381693 RepID=A0ABP0JJT7_9DINO